MLAALLFLFGAVLVFVGVALWSIPAALVLLGIQCAGAALALEVPDRKAKR